jgi:hypothetical protein
MRAIMIAILLVVLGSQVSCSSGEKRSTNSAGPEVERRAALVVTEQFLALLDGGAIDQTYGLVASSLRATTDGAAWEARLGGLREAAGTVLSRELRSYGYMGEVSDAPPGAYFVIEYTAMYGARIWLEKVVVSQEPDGWKIAGYFLGKMT